MAQSFEGHYLAEAERLVIAGKGWFCGDLPEAVARLGKVFNAISEYFPFGDKEPPTVKIKRFANVKATEALLESFDSVFLLLTPDGAGFSSYILEDNYLCKVVSWKEITQEVRDANAGDKETLSKLARGLRDAANYLEEPA